MSEKQNKNKRKVAVLCKTRAEAELVSKYLPDSILILNETDNRLFSAKSLITTTYFSKGLEFDVVIIPAITGAPMLLTKNLLYTAVTRAKKMVVLVGTKRAIRIMVSNNYTEVRYSMLKYFLKNINIENTLLK